MKQFLDFGEWMLQKAFVNLRVYAPRLVVEVSACDTLNCHSGEDKEPSNCGLVTFALARAKGESICTKLYLQY